MVCPICHNQLVGPNEVHASAQEEDDCRRRREELRLKARQREDPRLHEIWLVDIFDTETKLDSRFVIETPRIGELVNFGNIGPNKDIYFRGRVVDVVRYQPLYAVTEQIEVHVQRSDMDVLDRMWPSSGAVKSK